jgi:LPXTG-motif cell wall-anchored protein
MKRKVISILTIFLIISIALTASIKAATGSISVGASSESVIKGKTFTVTIAATADTNVIGLKANLNYDTTKLTLKSKKAGDNFTDGSANESELAFATGGAGSKSATICTLTFEALDSAAVGDTEIKISGIVLAADENINLNDETVTIKIKADDTTAGNDENNNNNTTNNGNNNNNTDNSANNSNNSNNNANNSNNNSSNTNNNNSGKSNSNSSNSNSSSTKKLPQTGIEDINILLVIALGAIALASYVSYKKYKNI